MENVLTDEAWVALLPKLRQAFPRITEADYRDCANRLDLVTAKIQNRHWVDRITARRQLAAVVASGQGVGSA